MVPLTNPTIRKHRLKFASEFWGERGGIRSVRC